MVGPSSNAGPRYAPPDPTLPSPWRALVDGNTGYVYYWNTESNVTQYEKPAPLPQVPSQTPPMPTGPPPMNSGPKLAPIPLGSSPSVLSSSQVKSLQHDGNIKAHVNNANINRGFVPSKIRVSVQTNLSSIGIPGGHQNAGGFSASRSTSSGLDGANYGPEVPGTGMAGNYKSNADLHDYNNLEGYERPRTQVYHETSTLPDFEAYKKQHEITVLGENVPPPFITFDSTGFPPAIMRELLAAGFTSPTPIQAQSWPVALQSRDIVAIAKTGSGKTLGYMLPAFLKLAKQRNNAQLGPTVLVLSPTRELATQIQDEATKFGRSSRITSMCVYGGAPKGPQLREIERGADIIIATPGRLNDFLEMKKVSLKQVMYLVLDEADRMLDMGFEPQIRKIVAEIPARRQTLMYTATWPKEVRKIAADLLVNAVQVNVGNSDQLSANKSITQHIEVILAHEKQRRLEHILRTHDPGSKIIIFCSTKRMCDQLARCLGRDFGAAAIHGDKSQTDRDWVLNQFKSGKTPILVATDVAARGLDIKDIRMVINYDFPTGIEDYVHRIGRTGRAGATGVAHTFFLEQDAKYAGELIKVLEGANQKVPMQLRDFASRGAFMRGHASRWDSGNRGREASRGSYGGRGVAYGGRGDAYGDRGNLTGGRADGFGGRGDRFGGRTEVYVGRGARSSGNRGGRFGILDRQNQRGDHDRFGSRDGDYSGPRLFSERDKDGDDGRRYGERDKGRSFSRSYNRSPSRSRGKSFSRSRSRSGERCAVDRQKGQSRSPLRSSHTSKDRGQSPIRGRSPYHRGSPSRDMPHHSLHHSSPPHVHPSPQLRSHRSPHPVSSAVPDGPRYRGAPTHPSVPRDRSPYLIGNRRAPHPHSSPPSGKSPYRASSPHSSPPRNLAVSAPVISGGLSQHTGGLNRSSPPREKSPYCLKGYSSSPTPHEVRVSRHANSSCLSQLHDDYATLTAHSSPSGKSLGIPSHLSSPHYDRADQFAPSYEGSQFHATEPPYNEDGEHA